MMSAFEDSQQQQQQQPQQQQPQQTQNQTPHTPLRLTDEAANYNNTSSSSSSSSVSDSGSKTSNNNNSIMGKVKLRVSSILPDSLSKWFSPSNTNLHNNATEQEPSSSLTHSESESQSQQSTAQHNGNAANLVTQCKLKRSRRRIQLEADDAGDNAVDDGTSAQDLNEEEVQLADNIAENDLAGEDEQTRRNEYNVSLLRKRQLIASEDDDDDDEDDEEEGEEEEEDELEDGAQQNNYQMQQANRISTAQPLQKRKRIEPNEITFSPLFNAQQRRLPPLHASTPAISEAVRSHQTSNRFSTHLNLYGNQRQREPAYDFMSTSTGGDSSSSTNIISEAAVATSGDLPMSSRRSLNIAPMTERRETALPSYKRQSLLGPRGLIPNWRSYQTISEDSPNEEQQQQQTNNNNNNNNNNNIKMTKRSTDSQSECESTESQAAAGRMHNINSSNNNNNNNSNGNALFYSNLQSRKSVFNRNSATSMLQQNQHHNSTLSLNSLNHRRRFNASIYGSTSALSDSRLLSTTSSHSIITGNSPFYQGPTAFGGSSANNRCFSQGNLPNIINSGGSSPAPSNSDSVCSNSNNQLGGRQQMIGGSYGIKPIDMRPRAGLSTISAINDRSSANVPGLSLTAQRILNLLENHRTPLMDAKKMGSTLREHKLQRSSRYLANTTSSSSSSSKPYAYPNHSIGGNNSSSSSNTSLLDMDSKSKLLVPTMLQLLERRRLTRVTSGTRSLVDAKQLEEQQLLHHRPQQPQQQQTANATPTSLNNNNNNNNNNNSSNTSFGLQSHTNKMRSRLSHQTRKDARNAEEQQLPPAPIDLPNIRFPKMASEPKFDLIIAPPSGLASAQQHKPFNSSNNNTSSNSNNNNGGRRRFLFPAPISVSCANPTEESAPLQKRAKNQASYKFSPPLTLDKSLESAAPKALQFNGETAINTTTTTTTTNSSSNDNAWPKSTATTTFGFGDQFKKSASEWECEACMLRNKQDLQKCVACETPKPKAKTLSATISAASTATTAMPATTLSFSGFGDRFKQPTSNWECNVCMLSNKDEHSKCIACETPRRNTSTASMSNIMGSNSNSFDSINNNNSIPSLPLNFDDVFKRPTNIWECPSCMIMNSDTVTECPACQTPNPKPMTKSNSSSSAANNKSTNSSSFKFGFGSCTAGNVEQPRPDAGFQQLIAAQKASSWNCEACMAQNDMNRNKCICCEQLKPGASAEEVGTAAVPKFMFGFPAKSTTETAAATSANATTTNTTSTASATSFAPIAASAAPFTPFTFGFAAATAGKDVADSNKPPATAALTTTTTTAAAAAATTTKAATTTTTATNTAATTTASATTSTTGLNTFKFGTETATNKTAGFTFGATAAAPQQQQLPLKTSNASTAATSSSSSSSNLLGGLFTTPTAPKTTSTATTLASIGFTFGSNSNTAATTTTAAATKPAVSNLFTLAGFAPPSAVVSSSSNIITTPNNSSTNTSTSSFKPSTTPMFNFGSNIVSSSSSSVTSPAAAGAKTTSALFGAQTPTVVATSTVASTTSFTAAPAIVASTTSFTTGPAMPTFVFGNTTAANSPATTVSSSTNVSSNNTKNFIFGSPTATTSTTTTATFAPPATGSSIFGSIASVQSNNSSSFNAPTSSNSTPLFTFGSASNMNANANNNNNNNNSNSNIGSSTFGHTPTFNFGGPKPEATTTATAVTTTSTTPTLSSFGWPTATTSNAATPFGSATPFANSPATSAGATAPLHIFGSSGNGTSSNLFGSNTATRTTNSMQPLAVSSPFGAATAATTGGTAVVHPTAGNGPISTLFGNVNSPFSSNAAGAANSGGGSSITSPLTNIFSAKPTTNIAPGAGAAAATTGATAPKMAFNFAPATTPAGGVFNFGSNVASNPGGNNALPKPAFNFTEVAPQTSAFNFSANSANASNAGNRDSVRTERLFQFGATPDAGASSSMMPAANNQLFNFTASPQQMQSTPSAAPFQFNAGSPASANIFAFNPPPNTGGAMQNPRRKIRAPVRRLPPR